MKAEQQPIRVLVTAIGGGGHGEQVLKALRLAPPGRYEIYGADANPDCAQFRLVRAHTVLPTARDTDYLDALLEACSKYRIQALFHGCEPELMVMSAARHTIRKRGIFLPLNPAEVIEACMDKARMSRDLEKLGFEPPRYVEISDESGIDRVDFFPAVVKPSIGGGGSANCYIVQNRSELRGLAQLVHLGELEQRFLVQEYIGRPDSEYTVGILHDLEGRYINGIAMRRALNGQLNVRLRVPNRSGDDSLGPELVVSTGVSHGYVDRFDGIIDQCREIASALGSTGPMNIQCRVVQDKVRVFEINPRFSGTTSIRAMMGFNEPDLLMRIHLFGEKINRDFSYDSGWVIRNLEEVRLDSAGVWRKQMSEN